MSCQAKIILPSAWRSSAYMIKYDLGKRRRKTRRQRRANSLRPLINKADPTETDQNLSTRVPKSPVLARSSPRVADGRILKRNPEERVM